MGKYDDFDLDIYNEKFVDEDYSKNEKKMRTLTDVTISACSCVCGSYIRGCTGESQKTISACQSYCGSGCR